VKTFKVIECTATVSRDPTSYGPQFSLLLDTEHRDDYVLQANENKRIKVRVEIEVESD
jgi:hypothetical protein